MTITSDHRPAPLAVVPAPAVDAVERSARARVPLTAPPGLFGRLLTRGMERFYGRVAEPGLAMAHNRRVLLDNGLFEWRVQGWHALDEELTAIALLAVALRIECSWCVDFGYFHAAAGGRVDLAKLEAVPVWRTSPVLSDLERRVVEFAEAATATPPVVTDAMTEALRADLGDAALVELTMLVAIENQRSRFNAALGLASQGFAESCRVPARAAAPERAARAERAAAPADGRWGDA